MAPVSHHVKVCPVRLREHSERLGVDVVRIVGYRCECSCGERGPARPTVTVARLWTFDHLANVSAS